MHHTYNVRGVLEDISASDKAIVMYGCENTDILILYWTESESHGTQLKMPQPTGRDGDKVLPELHRKK